MKKLLSLILILVVCFTSAYAERIDFVVPMADYGIIAETTDDEVVNYAKQAIAKEYQLDSSVLDEYQVQVCSYEEGDDLVAGWYVCFFTNESVGYQIIFDINMEITKEAQKQISFFETARLHDIEMERIGEDRFEAQKKAEAEYGYPASWSIEMKHEILLYPLPDDRHISQEKAVAAAVAALATKYGLDEKTMDHFDIHVWFVDGNIWRIDFDEGEKRTGYYVEVNGISGEVEKTVSPDGNTAG